MTGRKMAEQIMKFLNENLHHTPNVSQYKAQSPFTKLTNTSEYRTLENRRFEGYPLVKSISDLSMSLLILCQSTKFID